MHPAPQTRLQLPKKQSRRNLWIIIGVVIVLAIIIGVAIQGKNSSPAPTTQAPTKPSQLATQPTQAPTPTPKPTRVPTRGLAPISSASELSQLLSPLEGKVTDVSTPTTNTDGTKNVAVDVMVNNPTQTRVKHINYELLQFFFLRKDVGIANIYFHANGYSGLYDPIASCGGLAPSNWASLDESQLWDTLGGVFDVNLPA